MSSIIESYEYDIFISYRQKDNKHDDWVTEFVDNLKGELESTFKEEISVYFDNNPHDGLLETHDVDASLKDKLKCLIFIPIISRTYCDPKSFAWEHEFKAFVELASQDQFGPKVKLPNGNVASRILPVRIHDLDNNDIKLCESILGGVLRGIEFIYKESGFNRPLKPDDDEKINLNKTKYRNQIAKVALAIKEIITSIGENEQDQEEVSKEVFKLISVPRQNNKTKIIIGLFIGLALILIGYFFIPKLSNSSEPIEKSIAVLPFKNDSPDQENTYFINGIMEEVLNNLQKIKDFRVLSRNSVEQFRNNTTKSTPEIAKKLGVNYVVEGSGQKYGNKFVLRVQLITGDKEKHLWGKSYEKEISATSDQIGIQSEIAQAIATELKATITPNEKRIIEEIPTMNLTAYDLYQRGREEWSKYKLDKFNNDALDRAITYYKLALKSDSSFAQAYTGLALARAYHYFVNVYTKWKFSEDESKIVRDSITGLAEKALHYNKNLEEAYLITGWGYQNVDMAMKEYKKALEINPNYSDAYNAMSYLLFNINRESIDAIKYKLKAIELEKGPNLSYLLADLGQWYELLGFNEKAIDIYNQLLLITKDTLQYYQCMSGPYYAQRNWKEGIRWARKILEKNPDHLWAHSQIAMIYFYLRMYDSSSYHIERYIKLSENRFDYVFQVIPFKGYILWEHGEKAQATAVLEPVINFLSAIVKSSLYPTRNLDYSDYSTLLLAGLFSLKGEQKKAIEYLKIINTTVLNDGWLIEDMEMNPLFQNLRSTEQFQTILSTMKSNWQKEHESVRIWLEENNLLKI